MHYTYINSTINFSFFSIFVDSLYLALAGESLDELVKPGMENEWDLIKKQYFPRDNHKAYDKRTPGKFHTSKL